MQLKSNQNHQIDITHQFTLEHITKCLFPVTIWFDYIDEETKKKNEFLINFRCNKIGDREFSIFSVTEV